MNNQQDFQERLARLEKQERVSVQRVDGGIDPVLAKKYEKTGDGSTVYLVVKLMLMFVFMMVTARLTPAFMGVDLEARRAELVQGTFSQKMAGTLIGFTMIFDPYLMLDGQEMVAHSSSVGEGHERKEEVRYGTRAKLPAGVELAVTKDTSIKKIIEPIPIKPTIIQSVLDYLKLETGKRPSLYFPSPASGWFRLDARDLKFEAKPYYSKKVEWTTSQEKRPVSWNNLPLRKAFLSKQNNVAVEINTEGHGWYIDRNSGNAILLSIHFRYKNDIPITQGIVDVVESNIMQFNGVNYPARGLLPNINAGGLIYAITPVSGTHVRHLNYFSMPIFKYTAKLTQNVSITAHSTASQREVKKLLERLDLETLSKLFE